MVLFLLANVADTSRPLACAAFRITTGGATKLAEGAAREKRSIPIAGAGALIAAGAASI